MMVSVTALLLLAGCSSAAGERRAAEAYSAAAAISSAAAMSSAASVSSVAAASSAAAAASAAAEASRSAAAAAMASAAQAAQQSLAAAGGGSEAAATAHSAELESVRAAGADLDAAGDDNGAPCPNEPQYFDEQPIGLQPDVVTAWAAAEAKATAAGVLLCLKDGKRSRAHQEQTYADYVAQYGQAMADLYVLPPEKSAHVLGMAIDVQPYAGYTWLQNTNGSLGFCRTYDNEAWHFEFDPAFPTAGCPTRSPHPGA